MNETSYSNKLSDNMNYSEGVTDWLSEEEPKKPWYSFLAGPWLWAWWVGVAFGNVLAFVTFVSYLVDGNIGVLLWGPFLYPFWIILVAVVATIPLGIVFTCGVVIVKSMIAMYRALPFVVRVK